MARKKLVLPARYIEVVKQKKTVATRNPRTGAFTGRRVSPSGDTTKVMQVKQDVDVNHDGKIDFEGGTVIGRTTKVRASANKRAYSRTLD